MRTWQELEDLHITISKILFKEQDPQKMLLQSAELDMIAFFRKHPSDEEVKIKKELIKTNLNTDIAMTRYNMCNWFLNGSSNKMNDN